MSVEEIKRRNVNMDAISTGRMTIWKVAVSEWLKSPLVGNGFSGFGRFSTEKLPVSVTQNTTAHLYYLNVLWKGGVLFSLPFFTLVFLAIRNAWQRRKSPTSPEWLFAACAVLMAFSFPSLTWDILIVPSAGALAWFLLGTLGAEHERYP